MSQFTTSILRARPCARYPIAAAFSVPSRLHMRTLQTSACRLGLKESWDKEGIEKDIDHHKHDQLQKAKEGKNHWKEELASESETAVKADRNEATSLDEDISNLQQKTVEKVKKDHPRDRM